MSVRRQPNCDIVTSQEAYIDALLAEFGMEDCKPARMPMEEGLRLENSELVADTYVTGAY